MVADGSVAEAERRGLGICPFDLCCVPSFSPSSISISHQLPSSPLPIAAMPLALAEAAAPSAPLDKGKRVVVVTDDDKDSAEGQVFKHQRTIQHAPCTDQVIGCDDVERER